MAQTIILKTLYKFRDIRSKVLFTSLRKYCRGDVLDVGGGHFYLTAKSSRIPFSSWTNLESDRGSQIKTKDKEYKFVLGDGCAMKFKDRSFDTVLNIQVLEHVFEPIKMVREVSRVLRPGGYALFLLPQTATLHLAPFHYQNFTRYWILRAMKESKLEVVRIDSLGGLFSSLASNLFYFFLQVFRVGGMSTKDNKRNVMFYLFLPLTFVYALINIPILLIFSLGDLSEEPNNHFVVARKAQSR